MFGNVDVLIVGTGERRFTCTECFRAFTEAGNLKKHMRGHTGERPFACEICGKRFAQSDHLKKHLHSHRGENQIDEMNVLWFKVRSKTD